MARLARLDMTGPRGARWSLGPVDLDADGDGLAFRIERSIAANAGVGSRSLWWEFDPATGEGSIGISRGPFDQTLGTIVAVPLCMAGEAA